MKNQKKMINAQGNLLMKINMLSVEFKLRTMDGSENFCSLRFKQFVINNKLLP